MGNSNRKMAGEFKGGQSKAFSIIYSTHTFPLVSYMIIPVLGCFIAVTIITCTLRWTQTPEGKPQKVWEKGSEIESMRECGVLFRTLHTFCTPVKVAITPRLRGLGSSPPHTSCSSIPSTSMVSDRMGSLLLMQCDGLCGGGFSCRCAKGGHDLGSLLVTRVQEQHSGGEICHV